MKDVETPETGPLRITRMVHYRTHGSADGTYPRTCVPAIVTQVAVPSVGTPLGLVGLDVRNPKGGFFQPLECGGVAYDNADVPQGGTWHWGIRCPYGL